MKSLIFIAIFLLSVAVDAQADYIPGIQGGLGWSADGRFIAVGTTAGVHIHASDNLEKLLVLDETFYVKKIAWSNTDLRIAYEDHDGRSIYIYDAATGQRSELRAAGSIYDIGWSATDTFIAATVGQRGIVTWRVETGVEVMSLSLSPFNTVGFHLFEWSPDEKYFGYGGIVYGFAIFNAYTGKFFDFIWHRKYINVLKWSPDGNLLAAYGNGLMIWQINKKHHPHDSIDDGFIGDLLYERPGGFGPSWHPDSSKIAYVVTVHSEQDPQDASDFSGSHAAIWDLATDTVVKLPGVFIRETNNTWDVIEWSPDGTKLASISSDGRIVIWDASTFAVVAEYAGYRSILDM